MTIASEIQRIKTNIANAYDALETAGATMPATENSENLALTVATVPAGGDEITATNTTGSAVSADDRVWVEPVVNYTQNFSVGGNPAINNFTLTSTDYPNRSGIVYNMINPPSPQESVEVQLKGYINYNTSANYPNADTGYGDFSIYCRAPGSGGYPYESALSLFLGDGLTIKTNSGANTYTVLPRTSLVKDQMYWFKVLVTDSQIVASYSTDGSSWIDTTFSVSGLLAVFTKTYIGMSTATSKGYGTYDLLECYVKVDGNTVWTPYLASTTYSIINDTDITSTSFTGIAQANIANNSTGSVKTLLDGNGTYAPTTATKNITTNGTYTASAENAYGLSEVTVNVPTPDVWYNWKTNISISGSSSVGNLKTGEYYPDKILFGNNVYICPMNYYLYTGSTASYKYSTDGINWVTKTLPDTVQSISFGNGIFFAAKANSSIIYTSIDGENWNTIDLGNSISDNCVSCKYVNGICYITSVSMGSHWFYSTDGTTWNYMSGSLRGTEAFYGNNEYVMYIGGSGSFTVYKSTDGINWTSINLNNIGGGFLTFNYIAYGNGIYVLKKYSSNEFYTSTDLTNWTSIGSVGTSNSNRITFEDGLFLSADSYSNGIETIIYSSDGINWGSLTNSQSSSISTCRVVNGSLYLLGGTCFKAVLGQSQCYTLTASPTTSTQVYEIPKKTSALTITAVGTGTITLSDSKVYNRNSAGDVESPVLGTKTITSNNTYTAASDYLDGFSSVTVDVPSAPTKKYNLLDRVKDDSNNEIGTVSGFFTDANNVEYAVVCLDAQYRLASGQVVSTNSQYNAPLYPNMGMWDAKETATTNTTAILALGSPSACSHCRSQSFTIDNTTYYGQLPNMPELTDIYRNRTIINNNDTSASSYSSLILANNTAAWSSTQFASTTSWAMYANGAVASDYKNVNYFVIPVLEIPNT